MKRSACVSALGTLFVACLAAACSSESSDSGANPPGDDDPEVHAGNDDDDAEFESARPGQNTPSNGQDAGAVYADDDATDGDDSADGDSEEPAAEPESEDPSREIEEADIIKVDGQTLYALSRYGGLSLIDIAEPTHLSVLGRFKTAATPFEMYVRDEVAMVLYNGYGEYTYDEQGETWNWHQTSYVVAIDTTQPSQPHEIGRFHVPGYISDSRIVGDVMYVVAFEDGYCWECEQDAPRTNVISLDVGNPATIARIDELSFEERQDGYSWQRSVSATDGRLYVAGPRWGSDEPDGSVIQIIDISDAGGRMELGASVEVNGQIQSRWQMDEFDGVLRVVSQPFQWWEDKGPPAIETFRVTSSAELTPLGKAEMQIPDNETLRSVRFDGPRGYAITAEQMDPLFTLDLSDPAAPKQVGELEMPGWVYHMEPRGERVLGLGFDQGNEEGSIAVSLFDVSDLATPTLIDRVNFGGDWGNLAEDQDRIHKAFKILPEAGLLLVPFSGWSYDKSADDESEECYESGSYVSGVQLIDWRDDALSLRGVAPVKGDARRGFLHEDRLFTMSDDRVESFDIADRDEPKALDDASLAQRTSQVATDGAIVARVGQDWYSETTEITISNSANVDDVNSGVTLELPAVDDYDCKGYSYLSGAFASEGRVYVEYVRYDWRNDDTEEEESTRVISIDVSDADDPRLLADVKLDFGQDYYGYTYGLFNTGEARVTRGSLLAYSHTEREWDDEGELISQSRSLEFVDLTDPAKPALESIAMPESDGATGLLISQDTVATSHFTQSPNDPALVRFYLDRVDISNPAKPKLLAPINIPGSLVAYDAASRRAFSLDYRYETEAATAERCYDELDGDFETEEGESYDYELTVGRCNLIVQTLHLLAIDDGHATVLGSHEFEPGQRVAKAAQGDDRLFLSLNERNYYWLDGDSYGVGDFASGTAKLFVFSGLAAGKLALGELDVETGDDFYGEFNQLVASGHRVVVSTGFRGKLSVIDAGTVGTPKLLRDIDVNGWVQDLDIVDDRAIASLGYDGLQSISIAD